jgi:hypothetical protein
MVDEREFQGYLECIPLFSPFEETSSTDMVTLLLFGPPNGGQPQPLPGEWPVPLAEVLNLPRLRKTQVVLNQFAGNGVTLSDLAESLGRIVERVEKLDAGRARHERREDPIPY